MSFFGFGQSADIDIELDGADTRKLVEIKQEDGRKERYYLYYDGETVSGKVNLNLKKSGIRLEHQGIKIEFVGQIELYYDRGNHHEFTSLVKELVRPGELIHNISYDFEFNQVEKPYESYTGTNVRLRYFLRVTIVRRISDIVREMDLVVHTLSSYPDSNNSIKMEVGIEDCLHIEFEYNKSKYHLKDVIVGKIYFLLVRIKIKFMEIAIMKRETTGSGPNTFNENETIAKYEIMDGAPVRGESIPIRVFLAGYDLTPSMRDINKKFSVRYYLNLVLVDEEERRYFKQQEITLWRKGERVRRPLQEQLLAQQHAMQQLQLGPSQYATPVPRTRAPPLTSEHEQSNEVIPPLGAEPPSPHQSQSPMQEEMPPVPITNPTTTAPLQHPNNNIDNLDNTPAEPSEELSNNSLLNQSQTTNSETPIMGSSATTTTTTTTTITNTNTTTLPTATLPAATTNTLPVTASTTPPPLPTSTSSTTNPMGCEETTPPPIQPTTIDSEDATSPPIHPTTMECEATTPPPLPGCITPPPTEEDATNGGINSPITVLEDEMDTPASNTTAQQSIATKTQVNIPPLVCPTEPPELPSPPSEPLESPEDEEFVEATAASPPPPPQQQKKEAVAVAQ